MQTTSSSEGVLAQLPVLSLLFSADCLLPLLEGGESSAESAILLLSQINGGVLLLFELRSSSISALLVEHGEHLRDVLPHLLDHGQLDLRLRRHLRHTQFGKTFLQQTPPSLDGLSSGCETQGGPRHLKRALTRCWVSSSTSLASSYFLS